MNLGAFSYVLAGGAGCVAGAVNAVAGGGTLVSFPALQALGLPAVRANVTNIISLTPGYAGGTYAQRADLLGQRRRTVQLGGFAVAGGLVGSVLLLITSGQEFRDLVPFLILFSCGLLVAQDRLRAAITRREATCGTSPRPNGHSGVALRVGVFLSSVYGGFFGAGLGIMLLAFLGLFSVDSLPRLNVVKQALSFVISVVASALLAFSGHVSWIFVAVMVPTSLIGGMAGGRVVHLVSPKVLRALVVALGLAVAVRYWV
ncbi:MAG TPA: sulfite exporter TauE/SafE family protein [Acidimicrobiales bacterium]|nr:sulfite exporter TauE/SafE family protein [Acidimicrobiales bacterium]